MKTTKGLFLALASLGMFACSNEDLVNENGGVPAGTGAVTVKIVAPESRAISNPTTGENITVGGGDITVNLFTNGNTDDPTQTATISNGESTVKFWNVKNPTKITVSRNGGVESYEEINIMAQSPNMQAKPSLIPVFGSTTEINLTSENDSPDTSEDGVVNAGNVKGDENKIFQMYNATVKMTIPVARLEVSNIKHASDEGSCEFSKLTIDGVYLDNVRPTANADLTDYYFDQEAKTAGATGVSAAILKDVIEGENNFLADGATWPAAEEEQAKAFAYNFYMPATEATVNDNPVFKIYFKTAEGTPDAPKSSPRYAVITSYKDEKGASVVMENGKIYRITNATLSDENITGSENGETLYGVSVTVEEAEWTIFDITPEWAK